MSAPNFFGELKRRNVYKVAVAYAVVSWLLIQAASIVLPTFKAPDWTMQVLLVALAIGFPIAIVFAWAFEITPEGIRRERDVSPNESIAAHTGRKLIGMTIALAFIAAGLLGWQMLRARPHGEPVGEAVSFPPKENGKLTASPTTGNLAAGRLAAQDAPALSPKSIAVLPFENLSSDKENAYFAEGIQDEILTRLAKIGALKVISRTSTAHYASSPQNLPEIARQLGVANILEGSVQKAANAVHVNVQLIRAATDEHLWAESYNRKLDDIFGVEGEVAGAIADQLKATLSGSEKRDLDARPTKSPEAYDAYLRGLAFQGRVDDFRNSLLNSIRAFEDAVKIDPDFAVAWGQLCRQQALLFINLDHSPQRREAARRALDMAIKLGPDLVETELADGSYHYWVERDYKKAESRFEEVRRKDPNNPRPLEQLAAMARRQGQWEQSRLLYAQALELDPRNVFLLTDAVLTDLATRDSASARKRLERARDLSPQNSTVISFLATCFQMNGEIEAAQALLDGAQAKSGDTLFVGAIVTNAILLRKYESATAMVKRELEKPEKLGASLAGIQNMLGDLERQSGDAAGAALTYAKAKETARKLLQSQPDDPDTLSTLAWAETFLGNKESALDLARRAVALLPASKDAYIGPTYEDLLARIEAHFGKKDMAIAALQHLLGISYAGSGITPTLLRIDPDWDNLRGDPRFEALCQAASK